MIAIRNLLGYNRAMMDDKNKRIIELLEQDGRMTYQEIGNRLGISRVAAKKRVEKLEKSGVIAGYRVLVREDDIVILLMDLAIYPEHYQAAMDYFSNRIPEAVQVLGYGDANRIQVQLRSSSVERLRQIAAQIQTDCKPWFQSCNCRAVKEVGKDWFSFSSQP